MSQRHRRRPRWGLDWREFLCAVAIWYLIISAIFTLVSVLRHFGWF